MSTSKAAVSPGVWCPVVTLYKDSPRQEVDLDACYKYFTYLIRGGVHGLVLLGSTAEAALLSQEERVELIKVARRAAIDQGAPRFPLAAGISGQSTNETLRLLEDATQAGADYGLLLPPCYWPKAMPEDAIVLFYREVADNSRIPIIIYNFPGVTAGIDLSASVLSQLAPHPNIVGVKLTCANAGKVTTLTAQFTPDQFAVFSGQSDWLLPCLIGGGVGCVTGIGNVFPRAVSRLYELWQEGSIEEARKLQSLVALAESACKKGLSATKFGAAHFAGPAAGVHSQAAFTTRKPYKPAGSELQQSTIKTMAILADFEKSLPDRVVHLETSSAS